MVLQILLWPLGEEGYTERLPPSIPGMNMSELDVLIVGAGLSGIAAAYHLQDKCPSKRFEIVEMRGAIGGTWDLFRYPGIRSDSDMYTLGYSFRPWRNEKSIADGETIRNYVRETAADYGIDKKIRFNSKVVSASWSSEERLWTVGIEDTESGKSRVQKTKFLFMCSGYYDYDKGYTPEFKGIDSFKGEVVHPQKWDENTAYEGKRIVVIGSGATAVTLVPSLADKAASVTMLQRSPTYVVSLPAVDAVASLLKRALPEKPAYHVVRGKNILVGLGSYQFCRRFPKLARKLITKQIEANVGDSLDVGTHFNPWYNPWEQRLCLVPDADLFETVRSGKAEIVTDHIDTFVPEGIKLKSGRVIEADMVVTATGLNLKFLAGLDLEVDGETVVPANTMPYKGVMLEGVPNLAMAFGYTNASWTLKCELSCRYVCRLLNHMDEHGYDVTTPRLDEPSVEPRPLVDFSSGYFKRGKDQLPPQGSRGPWKVHQNYFLDLFGMKVQPVADDALEFQG